MCKIKVAIQPIRDESRQTNRQRDRQTKGGKTNRQADKQTKRQTDERRQNKLTGRR